MAHGNQRLGGELATLLLDRWWGKTSSDSIHEMANANAATMPTL